MIISNLIGGVLIGSSSSLLMLLTGQILGISGFLSNIVDPSCPTNTNKAIFIIGLLSAGVLLPFEKSDVLMNGNVIAFSISGLFVGLGARYYTNNLD
jgi:uncharacterized protein